MLYSYEHIRFVCWIMLLMHVYRKLKKNMFPFCAMNLLRNKWLSNTYNIHIHIHTHTRTNVCHLKWRLVYDWMFNLWECKMLTINFGSESHSSMCSLYIPYFSRRVSRSICELFHLSSRVYPSKISLFLSLLHTVHLFEIAR